MTNRQKDPKKLLLEQHERLLKVLETRFNMNMNRHEGLKWAEVQAKLDVNNEKLWSLNEMEISGGEPDVVCYDKNNDEYIFYDCSEESPLMRRNLCYDREALESRKKTNLQTMRLIWRLQWALRFCLRLNTWNFRSWEVLI